MKKTAKKSRLTLKQLAREVDELRELTARLAEVVNKHLKGHNETVLKAPSVGVVCRAIREMSGIVDNNSRASYNNDVRALQQHPQPRSCHQESRRPPGNAPQVEGTMAKPLRCKDIVGRRVKLNRDIATRGGAVFLKGTVWFIEGTYRGTFELSKTDRGVDYVTRVPRTSFDLVETDSKFPFHPQGRGE